MFTKHPTVAPKVILVDLKICDKSYPRPQNLVSTAAVAFKISVSRPKVPFNQETALFSKSEEKPKKYKNTNKNYGIIYCVLIIYLANFVFSLSVFYIFLATLLILG